jgi:hypothetical protein
LGLKNGTTRHKARRGCGIYLEFELEYPYLYADKYNFRQIISSLNTGTDALLLTARINGIDRIYRKQETRSDERSNSVNSVQETQKRQYF